MNKIHQTKFIYIYIYIKRGKSEGKRPDVFPQRVYEDKTAPPDEIKYLRKTRFTTHKILKDNWNQQKVFLKPVCFEAFQTIVFFFCLFLML